MHGNFPGGPDDISPAPLPDALYELIAGDKVKGLYHLPGRIPEGERNDTLFRIACSLRSKSLSETAIYAAVFEENLERCLPPLGDSEVRTICRSAAKYIPGVGSDKMAEVKPKDFSDAGNAEVFSRIYQDKLIYIDAMGWLFWNNQKWERNDHYALKKALELSYMMLNEAKAKYITAVKTSGYSEELDDEAKMKASITLKTAKSYLTHAQKTRSGAHIKKILEFSCPAYHQKLNVLDADPFDLNTPFGVVDLKTGNVRPHDPKDYISKITEFAPCDDGAQIWRDFLTTITCKDNELSEFLQMAAGMASMGAVYHEGIIIAYGEGRNGKSTFFNTLMRVMGDYAGSISINTLTTERTNKGRFPCDIAGAQACTDGRTGRTSKIISCDVKSGCKYGQACSRRKV